VIRPPDDQFEGRGARGRAGDANEREEASKGEGGATRGGEPVDGDVKRACGPLKTQAREVELRGLASAVGAWVVGRGL